MTHFSFKLQITKSFHCSGPLQETLNLTLLVRTKHHYYKCVSYFISIHLSHSQSFVSIHISTESWVLFDFVVVLLFQIEILQSYFFHREQFLIETFDQALSLSLSVCVSLRHILCSEVTISFCSLFWRSWLRLWKLGNNQIRPWSTDHLSLGEVENSVSTPCCVVSVMLSVEPPRYDMRYDICQRRAGWEGSLTRATPAAHMGTTASSRDTLQSTHYYLPCALQGAGASLGHLSLVQGGLWQWIPQWRHCCTGKVDGWLLIMIKDPMPHSRISSICVARLLRAECEVRLWWSEWFLKWDIGLCWAASWGLKWPRLVLGLARKETMRIV